MTNPWPRFSEPLRETLLRTGILALVLAIPFARSLGGGASRWLAGFALALWPAFGGHWVEVWFLNWLRPRVPVARAAQGAARLATWFAGGLVLVLGMRATADLLGASSPVLRSPLWLGGLAFVAIELVAHLAIQLAGRPSFYNGRG